MIRLWRLCLAALLALGLSAAPSAGADQGWSTSNFLSYSAGLVTAVPVSICVWAKTSITGSVQELVALHASGSANNRNVFDLSVSASNTVSMRAANGSGAGIAGSSTTITANTWFSACGVAGATASRAVYLNGGGKGTDTTSLTPTGINETLVGVANNAGSKTNAWAQGGTGAIAWGAVWTVALTDADALEYSLGVDPRLIEPASLVAFWPLEGIFPEYNLLSNTSVLTEGGTLTVATDPALFRANGSE